MGGSVTLHIGDVVKGAQFPETVEIKKCEAIDSQFYLVEAVGRQTTRFYELMIEAEEVKAFEHLNSNEGAEVDLTVIQLQHFLQTLAFDVMERYSLSRALGGGKIIPLPHQIEAVYGRMLQVPKIRFLLADDPGAGKTIMAGMLMRELRARQSAERILILVPPLVLIQWQDELREKFQLDFTIINRAMLRSGNKNPFVENDLCLASVYWSARDEIKNYICEAEFNLIIVDEAHKMAAYTHGKQKRKISRTKLYQLGETILRQTEHCLLLTATPHKGDLENFRHLMSLIDQDIFANISANETIREKSNPFIIRRLKESLKNFDGTPIFPKRVTKTIGYTLSAEELQLYEAVTDYVQRYFNKAMDKGNHSTAFAMMLLQRRLSSSIEAIHLSLQRRRERLQDLMERTLEEREKYLKQIKTVEFDEYDIESAENQQQIETKLEQAVDGVDINELSVELAVLNDLITITSELRLGTIERKYQELEATLFGVNGLLNQGEKILIFTESVDTLHYLEERLAERISKIAKVYGRYSLEERRRQVELFRNEYQIMLATDAGGESINLQFCNQMINYDIPWNPNRLEQRMGRIHRIGQRNEVAIFNLVATNTREGEVLGKLLQKMEQMREDLGSDLVYDFVGEVLEDRYYDLPSLMQEAIMNRENLDTLIAGMEKVLSEENRKLLDIAKKEQLDPDAIDLPNLRREHHYLLLNRISNRSYELFVERALNMKRVRVYESNDVKVKRIERLPKFVRDFARKQKIDIKSTDESYRFTGYSDYEDNEVQLVTSDHPLFKISLELSKQEQEKKVLGYYQLLYPTYEPLMIQVFRISIGDGTGNELSNQLIYLAKRTNGEVIELDHYWLFGEKFVGELLALPEPLNSSLFAIALKTATVVKNRIQSKRLVQLNKVSSFLHKSFETQKQDTLAKIDEYQRDNADNHNSALINQMNARLIDLESRSENRLNEVERQKNIYIKPPKLLAQMELLPNGQALRVFPKDYQDVIEQYEHSQGRKNITMMNAFGLVDFYSERINGEPRFIIISNQKEPKLSEDYLEDLKELRGKVFVYVVADGQVLDEIGL
jgi:superfamily II DNA or RNA helicase